MCQLQYNLQKHNKNQQINTGTGLGEEWLINLTISLRNELPFSENYIISHAPQAPYFMGNDSSNGYPKGGYLTVHSKVGSLIDWYNIQFYNQELTKYSTYSTLFEYADGWANNTSVYQMMNGNNNFNVKIDSSYIVVGKPVTTSDASNTGYVDPNDLQNIFNQAIENKENKWNTGFMTWQFRSDLNQNFDFVNTVVKPFQ